MRKFAIYLSLVLLGVGGSADTLRAQNRNKAKTGRSVVVKVATTVYDQTGKPVPNAQISVNEGDMVRYTDAQGNVSFDVRANSVVLVEADGYTDYVYNLRNRFPSRIVLVKRDELTALQEQTQRFDGGRLPSLSSVSATAAIDGSGLARYPEYSLSNTLQGKLPGVTVRSGVGAFALNTSTIYVRGQHRNSDNGAIVVVDGIERDWEDLIPEEIETVRVMKDATAKILYGSRAANGVLEITTRRGEANKRQINVSAEMGVMSAMRLPAYLDSYRYATLYNEARANDGLPAYYSDRQLEGYRNSKGMNDLYYPDVDYYDLFLQRQSVYRKAVFDLNGGTDRIRYALVANYVGGSGYEKVGKRPDLNRFNVRGNLDVKATDFLNVIADAAVRFEMKEWGSLGNGDVFTALSTTRPNEYPLLLDAAIVGVAPNEDGTPIFGASMRHPNNLYAQMAYGGFIDERYVMSQTNLGLDFTLDRVLKGLGASAFVTFDNYTYFKKGQTNVYPTYALVGSYEGYRPQFVQMNKLSLESDQTRLGEETLRTTGWRGNITYDNTFGRHALDMALAYNFYNKEVRGDSQDIRNENTSLRVNYGYDNRYLFEGTLALMGSNRFYGRHRYFLSGAVGLGWVLSNEAFLKRARWLDYLKLKASYGILGYDRATDFLLYETSWQDGGSLKLGEQNKTTPHVTSFVQNGNPDLKWESSREFNVGFEGIFFAKRLKAEVNCFSEYRDNIIGSNDSQHADVLGPFVSMKNIGAVRNRGVDFYVQWSGSARDFRYEIGLNGVYSKNRLMAWNEVEYPDEYRRSVGCPTDAMFGYVSQGLFGKEVDLNRDVEQLLGRYQAGDIAYADLNGDGMVDGRDQKMVGNSFPRTTLGLDLNLHYRGWGLYVLCTSELGVDRWLNNTYYWVKGEDKYSEVVLDRYHPVNNPSGTYPRLTTTQGSNNFINSTFWLQDASFFRLKNVELSYTFRVMRTLRQLRIYLRGTNLLALSKEKNLDPELINAGVTNYPNYTTVTGGLTVTF